MISDSPYDFKQQPLSPTAGMAAGVVASILMLIPIALSNQEPLVAAAVFLSRNGEFLLPAPGPPELLFLGGLALQVVIGMLLGALYAVSQQSGPGTGFATVGAFYGMMIWLVSRQIIVAITGESGSEAFRSWPWLVACLLYGLALGGAAALRQARGHAESVSTMPLD